MPHDFFLSYACLDDKPAIPGRPDSAWITTFREALNGRLQFYLRREVDAFFDNQELSGNSALTPKIEAALDNAHLFVAISSPTYYARPWCKLERARFLARLQPNPVLAERVFVIHLTEVDPLIAPLKWQQEFFADMKGYDFFREKEDGRLHPLGSPALDFPIADANSYYEELESLAQDMARRIGELERPPAPAGVAAPTTDAADVVFLAENAIRSRPEREELRTALFEAKYDVRSAGSLVGKSAEETAAAIAGALAFVQIVSPVLLELPDGSGATFDQAQLAAAGSLPRFRWRAPELDVDAAAVNYAGFKEFALAPDVRAKLLPKFKEELLEALKDLAAKKRVKQAVQGDERLVLVTGDPADLAAHGPALWPQLRGRAIGHVIAEAAEEELAAEDVHGFLVLYGDSPAQWVKERLSIVRKLPKTRRSELSVGVYFCAPPPPFPGRELLYDMPSFHKIRWDDPPSFDAFAAAVAQ
jgi:hypothetical protein